MIADIKFYLSIFWRRSPLILLVFLPSLFATFLIVQQMPVSYQTSARLLLEAPSIPEELTAVQSDNRSAERMAVIQQRLLTRANLLEIAETYSVFPADAVMSPDDIVNAMSKNTSVNIASGRNSAIVMTIQFEGRSATVVADVVNDYVTRILREDVELRQGQARQTEDFFRQEVERLSGDLDIKSTQISAFRSDNSDALPETFEFRLERLAALEERSADLTQEVLLLREQRRQLADALIEIDGSSDGALLSAEEQKLQALRQELTGAMEAGGETSPRVRILQSRIAQVEQIIASLGGGTIGAFTRNEQLNNEIAQIDTQLEFLDAQIGELQVEMDELTDTLERTPAISITLADLERDYENVQQQYNNVVDRLAVAETTERIELLSRGERISVLDPATIPDDPFKPNRLLLMAAGGLASLGLAFGLVLAMELLNPLVKRPSTIVNSLGITPIATLPYIRSNREIWADRALRASLLCLVFVGVPAIFWAVHTYYLPLDLIAEKVLDRLGV
ncbi:MAG: lipopolysaccharide biosynthesis [Pseudomonadota bacterium]